MTRMVDPPGAARIERRKEEHLALAASPAALHHAEAGFDAVRLAHRALPGRALADVDLGAELLGRRLEAPVLISSMTGGAEGARQINASLAESAAEHGVALGLGSGRGLLADPALATTFFDPIRSPRPPLLIANLGGTQLRSAAGPDEAARLVEMLDADALYIHLNPLQEALQPEGDRDFSGVLEGIANTVDRLAPLPVMVKEVGFGLHPADVTELAAVGVAGVDVAGAGGTNWAMIEGMRSGLPELAAPFANWGHRTPQAITQACAASSLPVVGSGGLRHGVDVARCLALGAVAGGLARPALLAARDGRAREWLGATIEQLRIATWLTGAPGSASLNAEHLELTADPFPQPMEPR